MINHEDNHVQNITHQDVVADAVGTVMTKVAQLRQKQLYGEDGDDAKSGGANLLLGSSEYKEYVMDNKGIGELEQDIAYRQSKRNKALDKADLIVELAQTALTSEQEQEALTKQEARLQQAMNALSPNCRNAIKRGHKVNLQDEIQSVAQARALETETLTDDKAVARKLPKELEQQVYDDSVSLDDFYPGSKTLNKYLN